MVLAGARGEGNTSRRGGSAAWSWAIGIVVVTFAASLLFWSRLREPLGPIHPFLAVYGAVIGASESFVAVILGWRAIALRSLRSAILAGAYTFSTPLVLANLMTLPGLLTPAGTFGHNTPPWSWLFWHTGWSAFICAYAWLDERRFTQSGLFIAASIALSVLCGVTALNADDILPPALFADDRHAPSITVVGTISLLLIALAGVGLLRRREAALDPWVFVAAIALAFDVAFNIFAERRFALATYLARGLGAANALIVLSAVAGEYIRLSRFELHSIAEREALEVAQRKEASFRRLAESIPQLVWTATPDGSIDWYNNRWYAYTGQSPQEAMGWGWQTVHHPEDLPVVLERWPQSLATGEPFDMEFRLRGHDGRFRWFLTRVEPLRDEHGNVVKWYGTNTDIDERTLMYQREHRIAQALQEAFLPPFLPSVPGIEFSAVYRPATRDSDVGGDWYDAFALADGRLMLAVGDVLGHGLEASASMVRIRETVRVTAGLTGEPPAAILDLANRASMSTGWDAMVTAIVAMLDPQSLELSYASAGHPRIMVTRGSEVLALPDGALPLGIMFESEYENRSFRLQPGDNVVLYTDGLIEATRDIIEGERRLREALLAGARDAKSLVAEVLERERSDDVAVLMLNISPSYDSARTSEEMPGWQFSSDDATNATSARAAFVAYLRTRGFSEEDLWPAELIFGELVGNVVRHAPGPIELDVSWSHGLPMLTVRDRGPGFDRSSRGMPGPLAESGRGLSLVELFGGTPAISHRLGGGSQVRATLRSVNRQTDADLFPQPEL